MNGTGKVSCEDLIKSQLSPPPSGELIHQGAEARLYKTELYSSCTPRVCVVKERFVKTYRHPSLDTSLSIQRLRAEVRELLRCRKIGIDVPAVLQVDVPSRRVWLSMIGPDAMTLHKWFCQLAFQYETNQPHAKGDEEEQRLTTIGTRLQRLTSALGRMFARLHANHIIHGDLTMANIMVHKATEAEEAGLADPRLALVDFGLSSTVSHAAVQRLPEEKAVDLYVFERALINAVDRSFLSSIGNRFPHFSTPEGLLSCVLDAYRDSYPEQLTPLRRETENDDVPNSEELIEVLRAEAEANLVKLDEVRLRGRKRLMIG